MNETRGRKQNIFIINRVKDMKDEGMATAEIAKVMNLSEAMVRYYLRTEIAAPVKRRESLMACFFKQPRDIQERIAAEIGYELQKEDLGTSEEIGKMYEKAKAVAIENYSDDSLMARCINFLNGRIPLHEIPENFNQDEIRKLTKIGAFMDKYKEFLTGNKCKLNNDEIIEELKKAGVK